MYRLRVLGGLAMEGAPESEGAVARPRPLALLAILAAAGERGVSRDKLMLYLWPESDTQRARNSLHQTLYSLRQELGQDALPPPDPNLRLNPAFFDCDLWDFEAAVARDDIERAIGLYGGEFLQGFALRSLVEFEHWMEEQRARVHHAYVGVLEAAARRAEGQHDRRLAVQRWRTLARLEPLSSRPTLGLMRALAADGDRAGALEHARDYEERVRRELGTAPDPEVVELEREFRSTTKGPLPETSLPIPPTPGAPTAPPAAATSPMPAVAAGHVRVNTWKWVVAVVAVAAALGGWWWVAHRGAGQPPTPGLVAVLPFTVEGGSEVQYLGPGLAHLLSSRLDGAGDMRTVDPGVLLGRLSRRTVPVVTPEEAAAVASELGAGRFVMGSAVESGGRLHLQAALYDGERAREPTARAAVEGTSTAVFDLVDQLTTRLLGAAQQTPQQELGREAASMTRSVDALKSYLTGEREVWAGRFGAAADAFQAAIARDSEFALAYYRLSLAAELMGRDSLAQEAVESAARLADHLPERDRLLLRALIARRAGDLARAEGLYRAVVDTYPDDLDAWMWIGDFLYQRNPLRGRPSTESRGAFERVLELDPGNQEAMVRLARLASIDGRRDVVDSLKRRLLALGPSTEVLESRAFRAFALGDADARKRVTRELLERPPEVPVVTAFEAATSLDDLGAAERFARLLRDPRYSGEVRGMAYRLLARAAVARGSWSVAQAQLDSAERFDSTAAIELRSLLAALPFVRLDRPELLAIRRRVERWQARVERPGEVSHSAGHRGLHPYIRLYRLGLLDVRLGDMANAERRAAALERASDSAGGLKADALSTFARSIRARIAFDSGRAGEALQLLEGARWEIVESVFEAEALDRYFHAELLHAVGRDAEALDWYHVLGERATYELVYLAPAQWRRGQILEQRGDRAGAVEAYQAVARLWADADAPFLPVLRQAQYRLRALAGP